MQQQVQADRRQAVVPAVGGVELSLGVGVAPNRFDVYVADHVRNR